MNLGKIKHSLYRLIPRKVRKDIKNFYYDRISFPIYHLKHKFYYGYYDFFDAIGIETTTYCNFRCKFCPNSKYERGLLKNKKLLDSKIFEKIINELSKIHFRGKVFLNYYGEPLTDKRLPDFVAFIKQKLPKCYIQINTNGSLLTVPLYVKLVKCGVDKFSITQYGPSMLPNLKKLFQYLKKKSKKQNKISYRVFSPSMGISNRGGELNIEYAADFERPVCTYPGAALQIDHAGNVLLCCNDYHSKLVMGNMKNESLISIWNKPSFKKLRKEIRKKIYKLPICKKCVGLE